MLMAITFVPKIQSILGNVESIEKLKCQVLVFNDVQQFFTVSRNNEHSITSLTGYL